MRGFWVFFLALLYTRAGRNSTGNCKMCKKGALQQFKVPQGGEHAVLVHCAGGIVGPGLDKVTGRAHGHADPRVAQHGQVVLSVAKGHGLCRGQAEVGEHGIHALVLASSGGDDIQEGWVPPGGLQVGSPVQQQVFVLLRQEGDGLVQLAVQGAAGVLNGGQGEVQVLHKFMGLLVGIVDVDVMTLQKDAGEGVAGRSGHQLLHRLAVHGVAVDDLVAAIAELAAHGHPAVEGEQVPEILQHPGVPPGGDEQLDAPAVKLFQRVRHGGGGPVGAEADQGAVHVEEHGFYHKSIVLSGKISRYGPLYTRAGQISICVFHDSVRLWGKRHNPCRGGHKMGTTERGRGTWPLTRSGWDRSCPIGWCWRTGAG